MYSAPGHRAHSLGHSVRVPPVFQACARCPGNHTHLTNQWVNAYLQFHVVIPARRHIWAPGKPGGGAWGSLPGCSQWMSWGGHDAEAAISLQRGGMAVPSGGVAGFGHTYPSETACRPGCLQSALGETR